MSDEAMINEVADAMYDMVKEYHGKKNFKAMDLTKAMIQKYGDDKVNKALCKKSIRQLMDNGRCTYSYVGGSYITLPPNS